MKNTVLFALCFGIIQIYLFLHNDCKNKKKILSTGIDTNELLFYNKSNIVINSELANYNIFNKTMNNDLPKSNKMCNLSLKNSFDGIQWIKVNDKMKLIIPNCFFKWNAQNAKTFLIKRAPKGILFIGDSLTRYQYISLVYFLTTGSWKSSPVNTNEREFGSWTAFYGITNARLQGKEICDCYRGEKNEMMETRVYENDGLKIMYIQMFKPPILKMHTMEYILQCTPYCAPYDNYSFNFNVNETPEMLLSITKQFSYVFINAGQWYENNAQAYFSKSFFNVIQYNDNIHWKTTTFPGAHEFTWVQKFNKVFDTHLLTKPLEHMISSVTWDGFHFNEDIYHGLNEALLAYICFN